MRSAIWGEFLQFRSSVRTGLLEGARKGQNAQTPLLNSVDVSSGSCENKINEDRCQMSDREAILQQALALPPDDRAYLATALEDSLAAGTDSISNEELLTELSRRSAAYRAGETTARPAAEVLADLRKRQSGGTT